jgi:hypothetical protein
MSLSVNVIVDRNRLDYNVIAESKGGDPDHVLVVNDHLDAIFGAGRDLADFEVPIARFDLPQRVVDQNRTGQDLGVAAQTPAAPGPASMSSSWSASRCTSAYARRTRDGQAA